MSLDARHRKAHLEEMAQSSYDLLVIGGGITGAGIALDAASRGMRVALLEMQDFASGTSSRSTKLIHGGLRYLKQFEIGLVREVGKERAILHRNASHVVLPEKMLLPIVQGGTFGKFGLKWGLWLYDRLAGVKPEERRRMLSKAQGLAEEPQLDADALLGAGLYSEYRTDDARLVIEVMKTAAERGASLLNYAKVQGFLKQEGKIVGLQVLDMLSGEVVEIKAKQVVNAAGPWVDGLRKEDGSLQGKRLHHTKGVHIVLPFARLPLRHSVYFDIGDGRMMFAIPRDQWTYLGTTDTNFQGDLQHPQVSKEDCLYLLAATNKLFPKAQIQIEDIESSWAGIRPLIHEEGKSPSQLSRKDEIFESESGLVTIAGGKLTGFRKMAEKVVDLMAKRLEQNGSSKFPACATDQISLSGNFQSAGERKQHLDLLQKTHQLTEKEADWLLRIYGANVTSVAAMLEGNSPQDVLKAALSYSILHEGVCTLGDFFIRRSGLLYFGRNWIPASLQTAKEVFEAYFGSAYDPDPGQQFSKAYEDALKFE